jgi:hypothetical protein
MFRAGVFIFIAIAMMASSAKAATFTIEGSPTPLLLPGNHDGVVEGIGSGSGVWEETVLGSGLGVDSPGKITYTFVGKEAAYNNKFNFALGSSSLTNLAGGSGTALVGPGLLPFEFLSNSIGAALKNGDLPFDHASIAFFVINPTKALILFNDNARVDSDFDDMKIVMTVAPVPIPPALPLFASALAALGYIARRKLAGRPSAAN